MDRSRVRAIFDVVVVVAFAALGVALSIGKDRHTASLPRSIQRIEDHHLPWLRGTSRVANRVANDLTPFLAASGVGLAIATQGRGRRGRGAVGVAVVSVLGLAWLAANLARTAFAPEPNPYDLSSFGFDRDGIARRMSQASVGAWVLMALLGRWRAGRGWRERLARGVGWGWAVEAFFASISTAFGP